MRPTLQPLQPTHAAPTLATGAPRTSRLRALMLATIVLAAAAFATLASAPSDSNGATLASKQAQAAELDAQVREIEDRYSHLQERYRGAQYELDRLRTEVERAHRVVVSTRRDLGLAKSTLASRADAIYRRGGNSSELAELAKAGSFVDFFDRIDTMRRVGDQDATVLETVEALNLRVERKERVLRSAKAKAAATTRQAKRAKEQMGDLLAQRQARLDGVNADIRAIMEQQRRAAAVRAAAAARESAALARPEETASSAPAPEPSGESGGSTSSTLSIPLPPGSSTAASAANIAMGKLGAPYVWAGSGPDTFDCSGLVMWAFAQAGRPGLPHSTYSLINMGVEVPLDQLQVGDLVFPSHIGHVGMYVGGGSFVHAPSSGDVVKVTSMSDYSIARARRL